MHSLKLGLKRYLKNDNLSLRHYKRKKTLFKGSSKVKQHTHIEKKLLEILVF